MNEWDGFDTAGWDPRKGCPEGVPLEVFGRWLLFGDEPTNAGGLVRCCVSDAIEVFYTWLRALADAEQDVAVRPYTNVMESLRDYKAPAYVLAAWTVRQIGAVVEDRWSRGDEKGAAHAMADLGAAYNAMMDGVDRRENAVARIAGTDLAKRDGQIRDTLDAIIAGATYPMRLSEAIRCALERAKQCREPGRYPQFRKRNDKTKLLIPGTIRAAYNRAKKN